MCMRKMVMILAAIALLVAVSASAQSVTPVRGDLGLGASVSTSNEQLLGFWNVTDSILIEPMVGFYNYKEPTQNKRYKLV